MDEQFKSFVGPLLGGLAAFALFGVAAIGKATTSWMTRENFATAVMIALVVGVAVRIVLQQWARAVLYLTSAASSGRFRFSLPSLFVLVTAWSLLLGAIVWVTARISDAHIYRRSYYVSGVLSREDEAAICSVIGSSEIQPYRIVVIRIMGPDKIEVQTSIDSATWLLSEGKDVTLERIKSNWVIVDVAWRPGF